jgi:hypothetical protein
MNFHRRFFFSVVSIPGSSTWHTEKKKGAPAISLFRLISLGKMETPVQFLWLASNLTKEDIRFIKTYFSAVQTLTQNGVTVGYTIFTSDGNPCIRKPIQESDWETYRELMEICGDGVPVIFPGPRMPLLASKGSQ